MNFDTSCNNFAADNEFGLHPHQVRGGDYTGLGPGADAFFRFFARTKWAQTDVGINIIISNKSALCWIINWTTGSESSHSVYTRQKKG